MTAFLTGHPIVAQLIKGAVTGVIAAAVVDVHAFMTWRKVDEAKAYDWGTAVLRWAQGAISGALAASGYGALIG